MASPAIGAYQLRLRVINNNTHVAIHTAARAAPIITPRRATPYITAGQGQLQTSVCRATNHHCQPNTISEGISLRIVIINWLMARRRFVRRLPCAGCRLLPPRHICCFQRPAAAAGVGMPPVGSRRSIIGSLPHQHQLECHRHAGCQPIERG